MPTEPRERPILFSAPMVLALMRNEHPKTVTRRVLKPQPTLITSNNGKPIWHMNLRTGFINSTDEHSWPATMTRAHRDQDGNVYPAVCPYGSPGDRLWVRETWAPAHQGFSMPPYVYRADGLERPPAFKRWLPSIHMPRYASRLTLEVVSVRVERLHDITEEDAKSEGVEGPGPGVCDSKGTLGYSVLNVGTFHSAREAFSFLWKAINGPESWEANPWVFRIAFRRVS